MVFSAFTDNVLSYCKVILPGLFWYTGFKIVRGRLKLSSAFSGDGVMGIVLPWMP